MLGPKCWYSASLPNELTECRIFHRRTPSPFGCCNRNGCIVIRTVTAKCKALQYAGAIRYTGPVIVRPLTVTDSPALIGSTFVGELRQMPARRNPPSRLFTTSSRAAVAADAEPCREFAAIVFNIEVSNTLSRIVI